MNLDQASDYRNLLGKVGALLCIIAFLSILDGLIARFREPPHVLKVLPGTSVEINGPVAEEAAGVQDLTYESTSEHLTVKFEEMHKGYFLGGDMWRGQLTVSPQIRPGEYRLIVSPKGSKAVQPPPAFRVMVYADPLSLQRSEKSLIQRHLGFSPWGAAAAGVPVILLTFGLVYYLSGKRESLLAQGGRAEVYRVVRREGDSVICFALGTAHGVMPGTRVTIFNDEGQPVGTARVEEASVTGAIAVAAAGQEIKTGYIVSR